MRKIGIPLVLLLVMSIIAAGCDSSESTETTAGEQAITTTQAPSGDAVTTTESPPATTQAPMESVGEYPREETLYTSGTQWGPPSSWNPLVTWGYATGTVSLVYETLFTYDPLADTYTPWLAESGEWTSDNEYSLRLREGISWTDGEPFNADDVVFTFELGQKFGSVQWAPMWDWLDSVTKVDDYNVTFTFNDPLYQEWDNFLYSRPMVAEHLWADLSEDEVVNGANENPVGTGPYMYLTHDQDRMVWVRNADWWGTTALDLDPKPKYIVDIVNGSNSVALGLVLQGGLDLSNNFLPGVASLVTGGYGVKTYYPEEPYMLSANTAWLVTNNTKPPMDDPEFRKALAHAVDVDKIVSVVYGNIVAKSNPTGLLPPWEQYVDQDLVDSLGFSYDPARADALLAAAGYTDSNGDGYVENKDGSPIELTLIVPSGWTDWMESIRVIAEGAQAVGINVVTDFPDYGARTEQLNGGTFDLAIANDAQLSNTPWTYYDWIFQDPILDQMTNGNFGRYENQEAFDLVVELDKTPTDDIDGMKVVISDLQEIFLTDLPVIPLWYNGLWSQYSDAVWTGWPGAGADQTHYLPATWRGYWNMTGLQMLANLEPQTTE